MPRRARLSSLLLAGILAVALPAALTAPLAAQSGSFGNAVLFQGDQLLVGEPNNSFRPGTVYLYTRQDGSWVETGQLTAPDAARADGFGALLASNGTTLFAASRGGSIHAFERAGSGWTYNNTLDTEGLLTLDPRCNYNGFCGVDFGISMAASGDWLLVGQSGVQTDQSRLRLQVRTGQGAPPPPAGMVYAYRRGADGGWVEAQRFESPASASGDAFGAKIAMLGDRALISAPQAAGDDGAAESAGRVFEFRLRDGSWQPAGELPIDAEAQATFGAALTMTEDRVLVGAPNAGPGIGAAYLYDVPAAGGSWARPTRFDAPDPRDGDVFGHAVAMAGSDLWVGAPVIRGIETGMTFIYSTMGARILRFTEQDTNTEDSFGHRIVSNGEVVAVTASGLDHAAGGVFLYEQNDEGAWRQVDLLISPPDAMASITGQERRCSEQGSVEQFDCSDIELYAYIPGSMLTAPDRARGTRANDNWGWTDPETGREYALIGRNDGTSFIDITDPTTPILIGDLPKTLNTPRSQLWRDIKTYKGYAFIVADGAGAHGMQVFDLARLRDVGDAPVLFEPDLLYRGDGTNVVESTHNIIINEETGFAYLTNRGCQGLHMVDINEPLNPTFVGCADTGSSHDAQCVTYEGPDADYQGREICLRMSGSRFQISDVTDKSNAVELSTATHPNPAYMHQGWLTEDQRYFIMNDESDVIAGNAPTTRTLIWDVTDLEDPILAREFFGSDPASAHNLYVKGDFTYQANYKYGLHILDTSDPLNPVEVGKFDTAPYGDGPGFGGAWSNYPFFESGAIIVTSMQEGLFVLKKRTRPIT